jgi:hypothetical protein
VPDSNYVYPIEDLLADINKRTGMHLELHPFWKYPIWEDLGASACFKVHEKIPDAIRIMHLSIPAEDLIVHGNTRKLGAATASRLGQEIVSFFAPIPA